VLPAAILATALGGCAVVEGLSQYGKVDCSQGACDDASEPAPDGTAPTDGGAGNGDTGSVGAADASDGGAYDAGPGDAAPGGDAGGCGPLNSVDHCGACGAACDTQTGTPSCTGATCTYACLAGRSDCNTTAPDTDGCECVTPGCCASGCQTSHADGVGQSYFDCNPAATYSEATAIAACTAYAASVGASAASCVGPLTCPGSAVPTICFSSGGAGKCANYCWQYTGVYLDGGPGTVWDCACPAHRVGSWN
jgi:hypothetical protein